MLRFSYIAEREDHIYMAKLAEQAERYDDMVASMKKVCLHQGKGSS